MSFTPFSVFLSSLFRISFECDLDTEFDVLDLLDSDLFLEHFFLLFFEWDLDRLLDLLFETDLDLDLDLLYDLIIPFTIALNVSLFSTFVAFTIIFEILSSKIKKSLLRLYRISAFIRPKKINTS